MWSTSWHAASSEPGSRVQTPKSDSSGVLVSTSFLADQAYTELRQDGHPVVVLAAADIVTTLQRHGVMTPADVQAWLHGLLGPASQPASP